MQVEVEWTCVSQGGHRVRSRSGRKVCCPGDLVQDWAVRAHLPPPSHPQWSSLVPWCPAEPRAPRDPSWSPLLLALAQPSSLRGSSLSTEGAEGKIGP